MIYVGLPGFVKVPVSDADLKEMKDVPPYRF